MIEKAELVIVGAGPAGLAAAATAADAGLQVVLLDEQPEPGGQIYRAIGSADPKRREILGEDYAAGSALVEALRHPDRAARIALRPGCTVWEVAGDRAVHYSRDGRGEALQADHLLLATGAQERPMPFSGWTLPGVLGAGAGQILLKAGGLLPEKPILAGSGPLLFLLAAQYLRAGVEIAALVETTPPGRRLAALPHLKGAIAGHALLRKGLGLLREIRKAKVPHYKASSELQVLGRERTEGLAFRSAGKDHEIAASTVLIHNGVVPNLQITRSLRLPHDWDALQRCWRPRSGAWGETELEGIALAGDGAGIAGAEAAALQGRLAGLFAARRLGRIPDSACEEQAKPLRKALARQLAVRPLLDSLYAPAETFLAPADEVLVCRCEEVTAGQIRRTVALGCLGPNQAKAFSRAGMGPCQGRFCGLTVAEIMASARGVSPEDVGHYRIRPPVKPVTLGEMADLAEGPPHP